MRAPAKILNVVGARPTFVKIAPPVTEMERQPGIRPIPVHSRPYYREAISDQFFSALHIRQPDFDLGVAWGSRATRIADIITRIESLMDEVRPDLVPVDLRRLSASRPGLHAIDRLGTTWVARP